MKLFVVDAMDDTEMFYKTVVASDKKEAEEIVRDLDCWGCLMFVNANQIDVVDGYKIKLEVK